MLTGLLVVDATEAEPKGCGHLGRRDVAPVVLSFCLFLSAAKGKTAYMHIHLPDASCLVGDTTGTATRTEAEAVAVRNLSSVVVLGARCLPPSLPPG